MLHSDTSALQNKTVDRFNREKLYIQLTRIFLDEISRGNWLLGERIPSESELCLRYNVSKITLRQAVNNLVSDGYLMKVQGKGTFVTSVLPVVGLAMKTRFTEDMFGPEVASSKELLWSGIVGPTPEVRSYLKTEGDIHHILCRRVVSGAPAYLDESFVPFRMLPDITAADVITASLYTLLQERAAKKIFKLIQTIEVSRASEVAGRYLDLAEGFPVLAVHRLLISSDDTPVAYTRLTGRSDRYKLQTEFERIR